MGPEAKSTGVFARDLIDSVQRKDEDALRAIIRQNNRRLFRLARSIIKDDVEAEDVVQESYLRAFAHLDGFRGDARLSTWLTRILLNEAYGRLRQKRPMAGLEEAETAPASARIIPFPHACPQADPERAMAYDEIRAMLERAIDALPDPFRVVVVARLVEEMSVEDTAELLGLRPETVKTRLHRARKRLRDDLERQLGPRLTDVFPFAGTRCERIAEAVLAKLRAAD
jgi:RNA polymerase sigma-70 factor (ECF subfamily)